jgi:hypothetical protein
LDIGVADIEILERAEWVCALKIVASANNLMRSTKKAVAS